MHERPVHEEAVCGPVLWQGERGVSVSGLSLYPPECGLGLWAGAHREDVGAGHAHVGLEVEGAVDLKCIKKWSKSLEKRLTSIVASWENFPKKGGKKKSCSIANALT